MTQARTSLGPISVVVCNYNGEAYLDRCLGAVAELEGQIGEVLVVDNASTDRSLAIVLERHPSVRLLKLEQNDGPCPARNAGLRAATNRWVLALDNDALVTPRMLVELERALMAAGDDVVIAQPRSVFASEPTRVHYDGGGFHYAGLIALRNFYVPLAQAEGAGALRVDCAVAVALLVDRERVLAAGGWDPRYFILFEDLDLSYRLRARGLAILSVESALVRHLGGTSGISYREGPRYPTSRIFLHARNRAWFVAKNYAIWTILVAGPGLCLYELASFVFATTSGGLGAWLKGKWAFLKLLGELPALRRDLRRARTTQDGALLVGGPLAITPALCSSGARRALHHSLDLCLRAWWAIARHLLPR